LIRASYPVEEYTPRTPVPRDSLQRFAEFRRHSLQRRNPS
jgi:hypothetical protein